MKSQWVTFDNAPFDALRFDLGSCELEVRHGSRIYSHSMAKPSLVLDLVFGPDRSLAYDELKRTNPGVERKKVSA